MYVCIARSIEFPFALDECVRLKFSHRVGPFKDQLNISMQPANLGNLENVVYCGPECDCHQTVSKLLTIRMAATR